MRHLPWLFLALVGCGGGSYYYTGQTGSATFEGGVTGAIQVIAWGAYAAGDDTWSFTVTNFMGQTPNLYFSGRFAGTAPAVGTYAAADSQSSTTSVTASGGSWKQTFDAGTVGTFSLTISSAGNGITDAGSGYWDYANGALTVTLSPETGNASTSDVTVNATF